MVVVTLALALFGASLGAMDVAMNIHAVEVANDAPVPLMSGFHGLFSLGGFVGSLGMTGLLAADLPGRFQIVPGQPTLVLDVAHNPHAVAALTANLDAMGYFPTTHAVFGAMADKDLATMLARIGPIVDRWYFTDLPTERAVPAAQLLAQWQAQNTRANASARSFGDPQTALNEALATADPADRIVVFGSFYTVGGVLKGGVPRLQAKHLPHA